LLAAPLARAAKTRQQEYLDIYLQINEAELMERHGDFRGALEDFKGCYDALVKINHEDPNWETALVLHRMADCKAKILELQPKADAQPMNAEVQTPSLNADMPGGGGGSGETAEVAELKQQLDAVKAELGVTKQKLQDSNAQSDAYRTQLEAVNQQMAALKGQQSADEKISKLVAENKDLTDKLAATEKDLDGFRNNPKSRLAQAEAQVKNLQDQLAASQEANKALQDTTTTLKQQLDQANADLVTANQKLAAAGPGSAEYLRLKRENEIMRGILTRELQEQGRRDMAKKLIEEEFDNLKLKSTVLQEHLDEATTVMTPPTTDEERALMASLRPSSPDVVPPTETPANTFVAVNPANSGDTNAAPNPAPPPAAAPSADTNVAAQTPPANPPAPADNGAATNAAPTPVAADTGNPGSATNAPDNATPNPSGVTVVTANSGSTTPDTNNVPMPPTEVGNQPPPAPTNTVAQAPATPPVPDKTVTQIPAAQTQVTDTTIQGQQAAPTDTTPDPTQYSTKARLPDDMRETAQEAADLFKNQKYDESAAKYQSIIDKYPESLYAWSNLGVVRFQQGKFDDALKALQQAVKLSPTDAFSYSNLGIVYYQLNQFENAIDALNAAKALDPNDPKTHNYLGCACSQKGWSEVAEKEFRKAIELDPNFGDAHFNLALVYATQKPPLLELARREYNRALELGIAKDPRLEKLLEGTAPNAQANAQDGGAQP
jgi:Flp pilus assembly protein TadD/predicted  nucleic acid-binding Zn-ribbon protein